MREWASQRKNEVWLKVVGIPLECCEWLEKSYWADVLYAGKFLQSKARDFENGGRNQHWKE